MVGASYARRLPRSSHIAVGIAIVAAVSACGHAPRPASPSRRLIADAESAEKQRDYHRARSLYSRAKAAATNDAERAYAGRRFALALVFWGEYPGAQRELEAVVALTPADAPSWHDLGIIRHRRGDTRGAELALRRAVSLRPREPRSRIALAALYARSRRWDAALGEYRRLLDLRLPRRIRDKVVWAIRAIEREAARKGR